jgi:hypothetical protein
VKEKFLTSVINAFVYDTELKYTTVHARARLLRGDLYLNDPQQQKRMDDPDNTSMEMTLQDCHEAIHIMEHLINHLPPGKKNLLYGALLARTLRLQSDTFISMKQYDVAIESLRYASRIYPPMQSKLITEIGQVKQLVGTMGFN